MRNGLVAMAAGGELPYDPFVPAVGEGTAGTRP